MTRIGAVLLLAFALLFPKEAAAPDQQAQDSTRQSPPLATDYRIGPRDLLDIRVFDLDQLNASVRVSEEGIISLPLIGEIRASRRTRSELEKEIKTALTRYVNNPQVSVFIREYESQRFSVIGAVLRPGTYEMVGRKTLIEAISDAGGINQQDSAGTVMILRAGFTGAPIEIDLRQLLEEGNAAYNIELSAGDTINVVPKRRFFIYIYGQVRAPGSYELREEVTLLQAISLAGGVAERAAKNRIRILRRKADSTQEIIQVNLNDIVDGKKPDVPIRPNDVIIVPETFF